MTAAMKTFLELFLLPGMAAILPWRWTFRLFQRVARSRILYPEVEWMVRGARDAGALENEEEWRSALRLTRIFSFADLYLSMFRGDRWMKQHVDVVGSWPEGAFLAVTYHWGAGMWALRHLKAHGKRSAFLSVRFDRATFQNSRLRYWYGLLRTRETSRAGGGAGVIFTGGSSAKIAAAQKGNVCVTALLDVPPKPDQASAPVVLFGRPARLRRGLARIAMEEGIPVVTFRMNLDRDSGRLKLRIDETLRASTESELIEELASSFRSAIAQDPCSWHGWSEVQCYFEGSA
jgi:hypothetical protein